MSDVNNEKMTEIELWNTSPKRKSKEYRAFLKRIVEEYNSNGKRTILLSSDSFFPVYDGVINVLENYSKRLTEKVNVLVLAPTVKGRAYIRSYPVLGVTSLFSQKLYYQVALPAFDRQCKKILKKLRIDLIHSHTPFFVGRYTLKLHKKRNIPLINTFHTQFKQDFVRFVGNKLIVNFLMRFIMKTFNGSDEVWTMHPAVGEVLRSYGYKGGDYRYLPNATTLQPPVNYEEERARARAKYDLGDKLVFIFVGRIVTQKNIMFIAEVLGELKRRGLDFRMMFVGDGPDDKKIRKKIAEEGVEEETIFTGKVLVQQDLCDIYAAADMFIFPSMYDTTSLVQVEAASRRTPTVFAEHSVTSCTVTHGENGYIFPCEKEQFAQGILDAVADRQRLKEVGENAFRDLYITWDDVVARAAQYYEEIISAREQAKKD